MYKPKLKYIFCLMRKRSLMPAMSVMRYMNSVGLVPQLLIAGVAFRVNQHSLLVKELNANNIAYEEIRELPKDYDVMFTEAMGCSEFEDFWLKESKKKRKKNIILLNELAPYQNFRPSEYLKRAIEEHKIHGMCAKIQKTITHYEKFVKGRGLFLINTGDPDWDVWKTDKFKADVKTLKLKWGEKIVVFCENFYQQDKLLPYLRLRIKEAEDLGFKVFVSVHPDKWSAVPQEFKKYCDQSIHYHVLFAAASHVTINITSSVVVENLLLDTKVGCTPAVFNCKTWADTQWLTKEDWFKIVPRHVDQRLLDMVSNIFDKEDFEAFLTSTESIVSKELVEEVIGRISVPSYCEYLFKTLDERLKK